MNRVLAPEGAILSFASPKESIQRKGCPVAACFLRSVVFIGGCQNGLLSLWQRAASLRAIPDKTAGARRGIREVGELKFGWDNPSIMSIRITVGVSMNKVNAKVIKIHDELFKFLLDYREDHKDFYFMPRQNNRWGRLDQGYWFPGNDGYLSINFYSGDDHVNKTGHITFGMYLKDQRDKKAHTCFIQLSNTPGSNEYESKKDVINKIMERLGRFDVDLVLKKDGTPRRWNRYYSSTDYLKNLGEFLVEDKPITDKIIKELKNPDIGFLNPEKSKQKIDEIVRRRKIKCFACDSQGRKSYKCRVD
ncbi:MAG: hypothetical protein HOP23_01530 [Methylococcaceae bacterium]|nr:hypothetical protein [Methylococcaceae bacterium]